MGFMGKPSKAEVHYVLPIKCCGNCIYSGFNSVDDIVCSALEAGNRIDAGGFCDLWEEYKDGTN